MFMSWMNVYESVCMCMQMTLYARVVASVICHVHSIYIYASVNRSFAKNATCIYICICICLYIYACICVCMCVQVRVCAYISIHMNTCKQTHAHTHTHTCIYLYKYEYTSGSFCRENVIKLRPLVRNKRIMRCRSIEFMGMAQA